MTTNDNPRIYVACLASYNSGILHGRWIDANQSADEIHAEIQAMLADGTQPDAEEWAIHDYENFHGLSIAEYEDIDKVAELAELIGEHGEAYAAYAEHVGADYATADGFQDAFCGQFDSEQAYAENYIDDCYNLEEMMGNLAHYFDYEAFARDLFISDLCSVDASEGGVYVFNRN